MIKAGQINYDENFTELLLPGMPFTNVNQIFSSQPHVQSEMTYTIQPNGGHQSEEKSVTYNFTPAAREFFSNRLSSNSDSINCHVEYKNNKYNPTNSTDKVFYNLNGRNVVGYMDKHSESGNIICVKYGKDANTNVETSMGPGVSEYTEITSNDVVSQGFIYCGGSSIYRNSKVYLNSGKVLQTYVEKTLYAPER